MDLSLFPDKEEWGTGDEAMDSKLSIALKKSTSELSLSSISEFYFFGISLKPRSYNPSFLVTIELVTKALFYLLNPEVNIDHALKKTKGSYYGKTKIHFQLAVKEQMMDELKIHKKYRYLNQLDFAERPQDPAERNPYVRGELKRSSIELTVKIIFKEFKSFLNEESKNELITDALLLALRGGEKVLLIENFAEIWYHQDQIYALSLRPQLGHR